jgi:hypothetical protein
MASILTLSHKLEDAGIERAKAEAIAADIGELSVAGDLVDVKRDLAVIKSELLFHRWAFGAIVALELLALGKLFI